MSLKILPQPVIYSTGETEEVCHPNSRGDYQSLLQPQAFLWFRNKLYVGHNWLSSLHTNEEPVWDPKHVPVGTRMERCNGNIDFTEIRYEGPPYRRGYAVLKLKYLYKPNDAWGTGNSIVENTDQGCVTIEEQFVLFPNCFMVMTWDSPFEAGELISPSQIDDYHAEKQIEDEMFDLQQKVGYGNLPRWPKRKYQGFHTPRICVCHKWYGDGENRLRHILRAPSMDAMRYDPRAVALREAEHPNGHLHCH